MTAGVSAFVILVLAAYWREATSGPVSLSSRESVFFPSSSTSEIEVPHVTGAAEGIVLPTAAPAPAPTPALVTVLALTAGARASRRMLSDTEPGATPSARRNALRVLGFDRDGGSCQRMLFPPRKDEVNTTRGSRGWREGSAASRGRSGESGGRLEGKDGEGGRWERRRENGESKVAGMLVRYSLVRVERASRRPTKRISVCHPVDWEDNNHLREDDRRPQERRLFR